MKIPSLFSKFALLVLSVAMIQTTLAGDLMVDYGSCQNIMGQAGQVSQCPANHVVWQIEDNIQPYGRFESFTCCRVRNRRSFNFMRVVNWSAHSVSTRYSEAALCPRGEVLIGVGFDSQGGAGTMRCARLESGRGFVSSFGVQDMALYDRGNARCRQDQLAVGLGDHLSPDGNIDALMCAQFNLR